MIAGSRAGFLTWTYIVQGLLTLFVKREDARIIVRGLLRRSPISETEFQMEVRLFCKVGRKIETIFLALARSQVLDLSSSIVKEIASLGGDISLGFGSSFLHWAASAV